MTRSKLMTQISQYWSRFLNKWGRTLLILGGTVTLSCMMLWTFPALAVTWYPTAEASQGQQQQLVDLDSIESLGLGQVRVASLYIDRRSGAAKQTAYVTEYDCQKRQFRDVQYDGSGGSAEWFPVDPDPLNAATMDYLCNLIAR
jgi:hypothetical protein